MNKLEYPKRKILDSLRANREEHIKIVREAQQGYREQFEKLLLSKLEDLRAGKSVEARINLKVPENHVDDFDRAIEMLEMCNNETLELEEHEFQCYVRNRWNWGSQFLLSNSLYSETAAAALG